MTCFTLSYADLNVVPVVKPGDVIGINFRSRTAQTVGEDHRPSNQQIAIRHDQPDRAHDNHHRREEEDFHARV